MFAISAAVMITLQDYQDIRVRKYFIELFAERKHPSTKAARDISMDLLAWPKSQRQRCVRYQHEFAGMVNPSTKGARDTSMGWNPMWVCKKEYRGLKAWQIG